MAESDSFCVQMEQFNRNVGTSWQELQIETDFCDLTLACEDKQIRAHKVIVSSFSSVLRNILKLNKNSHPLIYLRKVKYKDLQNLLNFIYQGEVNVPKEDLPRFLEVAEDLNIRGLSEANKEGFNSNVEKFEQVGNKATLKRKRIEENIKLENINEPNSTAETFSEQASEDLITDYTESKGAISTIENEDKTNKIKQEEDNEQELVSFLSEKQYSCGNCEKQFSDQAGLHYHTKSVHEGVRYSCDHCEYTVTRKFHLKVHVQSIHEGIQHPCNQCEYIATEKRYLKKHVESIHEAARYPCDQCDYNATQKRGLHKHLLKHQSGQ